MNAYYLTRNIGYACLFLEWMQTKLLIVTKHPHSLPYQEWQGTFQVDATRSGTGP